MRGLQALVPFVHVADVRRSIAFYERLGFAVDNTFEHGGLLQWAYLARDRAHLMVARAEEPIDPREQAVLLYLYADEVAAYHAELAAAGVAVGPLEPRFYMPSGEFRLEDPDGYVLLVGQA